MTVMINDIIGNDGDDDDRCNGCGGQARYVKENDSAYERTCEMSRARERERRRRRTADNVIFYAPGTPPSSFEGGTTFFILSPSSSSSSS